MLLAIPDEYLLKFHNVADAKSLWEAIKSRFGGNVESKKMQKNGGSWALIQGRINQKFLRSIPSSWNQIALIMRNKLDIDEIDIDDLYNNLRVYEDEFERKGHFARECRSGRSQGRRSYGDNGRSNASTNESSSQTLVAQDGIGGYDWSNDFEVEAVNSFDGNFLFSHQVLLKWRKNNKAKLEIRGYEIALESLESRIIGHEKNELAWGEKYEFQNYELKCKEIKINNLNMELKKAVKERDELKDKIAKWEESTKNLDEIIKRQNECRDKCDDEHIPEKDRFSKNRYKVVPPPITRNFLTPTADISFAGLDEYAIRNKIIESQTTKLNTKTSETAGKTNDANTKKPKSVSDSVVSNPRINRDSVIIEDWTSYDEEEVSRVQKVRHENQTVNTKDDKSGQNSHKQGVGFRKVKVCFVCEECASEKQKPVWDNTKRVNHPNFSKYPHLSETFVPAGVSSRTGLHRPSINTARSVCTARPSINTARPVSTARPSISTARPVCTARPSISTVRPVYASRSIYPRMDNVRPRGSCSPIKRSYYIKPAFRPKDLKQDVKTFRVKNMTIAGKRAVMGVLKKIFTVRDKVYKIQRVIDKEGYSMPEDEKSITPNVSSASSSQDASDTLPNVGFFNGAFSMMIEDVGSSKRTNSRSIPTSAVQKVGRFKKASSAQKQWFKFRRLGTYDLPFGKKVWDDYDEMMDYGFNFMNTKIHIDNESTVSVIKNPVAHSRTKHIEIQFHFIKDCYESEANTSGSAEDSMQLKELMDIIPQVSWKMKEKLTDFVTPTKASRETQEEDISPTILEAAKTLSKVTSQGVSKILILVKEDINIAIDEEISKEQIRQEEAGLEEAIKLQAQMDEEVAKQIHLDEMVAKRMVEEEALSKQQKKRKAQVQFEAQYYTEEDWDAI
ncbi:hypothetical protein Tco_1275818 [Tanacetum coccineum]